MIDEQLVGYWYLGSNKDNQIYGNLKMNDDGKSVLSLCGSFDNKDEIFSLKNIDIINGFTTDGKKVTLIDSKSYGNSISMPGMITQELTPSIIMIGAEFESKEMIKFKSIKTKYTDLGKWLNEFNLIINAKQNYSELKADYNGKFERTFIINNGTLKFGIRPSMYFDKYSTFKLTQEAYVELCKDDGYSFDNLFEEVDLMAEFLSLCIGEIIGSYSLTAKDYNNNNVNVYIQNSNIKLNTSRGIDKIFIPYSCIEQSFDKCIDIWFQKSEKLKPIINIYIDAMETVFHIPMTRLMRNNFKIDNEVYKKKIGNIINCVKNEKDREWLEGELKYSNEPTLSNRLKSLFKEVNFLFPLNSEERDSISYKIKTTRNYYTHFDEDKKNTKMNSDEIFYISQYLILTLRVLIMKELGIDEGIIKSQFDKTAEEYRYSLNKCKILFKIKNK